MILAVSSYLSFEYNLTQTFVKFEPATEFQCLNPKKCQPSRRPSGESRAAARGLRAIAGATVRFRTPETIIKNRLAGLRQRNVGRHPLRPAANKWAARPAAIPGPKLVWRSPGLMPLPRLLTGSAVRLSFTWMRPPTSLRPRRQVRALGGAADPRFFRL